MYHKRFIDQYLLDWATSSTRKPLLLRGARQVGKSTAVRNLGMTHFEHFVEINLEKQPGYTELFNGDIDVRRIIPQLAAMTGKSIQPGKTLLFIDEIQTSPKAIMSLRFFKEDMPELHVIAAGSLLEFALAELPTFGVGRIHSMFMYPMTFSEFLTANSEQLLLEEIHKASAASPLAKPLYDKAISLWRNYMLIGGMPEVVARWVAEHDYLKCQELQDDIIITYEDDFAKYKRRVNPVILRATLRSVAIQVGKKFVYSAAGEYRSEEVKQALDLLTLAGLIIPVVRTSANGLPLGSEADTKNQKYLMLDSGLLLRLMNMSLNNMDMLASEILTAPVTELVNKGGLSEMLAGLEIMRNASPNIRHQLYYWQRTERNSMAEIDYVTAVNGKIMPIEVKANTRGGMKSLWIFMREKQLQNAIRCSLENFGSFDYTDIQDNSATREVKVCPLFALSGWSEGNSYF